MPSGVLFLLGLYSAYFLGIRQILRMGAISTTNALQTKKRRKIWVQTVLVFLGLILLFFKPIQGQMTHFFRYHYALSLFYDYKNKEAQKNLHDLSYPLPIDELTSRMLTILQSSNSLLIRHCIPLYRHQLSQDNKSKERDPVLFKKLIDKLFSMIVLGTTKTTGIDFEELQIAEDVFSIMEQLPPQDFSSLVRKVLELNSSLIYEEGFIQSLRRYPKESQICIPVLLERFQKSEGWTRYNLFTILVSLGAKEVLPDVIQVLQGEHSPFLDGLFESLKSGLLYDPAFSTIFAKMFKDYPHLQMNLLFLFQFLPEKSPEIISAVLQNLIFSDFSRYEMRDFLKSVSQEETFVPLLIENLQSPHPNIRYGAIYFLGLFGTADLLPILEPYCEDEFPIIAIVANWAYFHLKHQKSVSVPIVELLKSGERQKCLYALMEIQRGSITEEDILRIPFVEKLTQHKDLQMAQQANFCLYLMEFRKGEKKAFKRLEAIQKHLNHANNAVRYTALWYLKQTIFFEKTEFIPLLIQGFSDPNRYIREISFFVPRYNIFSPEELLQIHALLFHSDLSVQEESLRLLKRVFPLREQQQLFMFSSSDERQKFVSIWSQLLEKKSFDDILFGLSTFSNFPSEAISHLAQVQKLVSHPHPEIRAAAFQTLYQFGDPSSVPLFKMALQDSETVVLDVVLSSLSKFLKPGDPIYSEIYPFLKKRELCSNASKALEYFAPPPKEFAEKLHQYLVEHPEEEEVRHGVLKAIWDSRAYLKNELSSFLPFLLERAKKEDPEEENRSDVMDILATAPFSEIRAEIQMLCRDSNFGNRFFALKFLLRKGLDAKFFEDELFSLFENETNPRLRFLVLKVLKQFSSKKHLNKLVTSLPLVSLSERYKMLEIFAKMKDSKTIPILLEMAQQEDLKMSLFARMVLDLSFKFDFRSSIFKKVLGCFFGTLFGIFIGRFLLQKVFFTPSLPPTS